MNHPHARIWKCTSLSLLVTSLISGAGCSRAPARSSRNARHGASESAAPVTVAVAMTKDVPLRLQAIGHVSAFSTVSVRSQVDGLLASVRFKEGDTVKAG